MADASKIQWTDATFNPWRGCTKVSAGCAHCYAETLSGRNPKTLGVWGPQGTRVVASEAMWREPLKWNRLAGEGKLPDGSPNADGHRPRVFCASLADVFEDWRGDMHLPNGDVAGREVAGGGSMKLTMQDVRRRLFGVIDATPNLDWLLVTKRPENVLRMWPAAGFPDAGVPGTLGRRLHFPNVWLGTSVENQAAADERIPHLLRAPAAVRFLSCEPLLGTVDLRKLSGCEKPDCNAGCGPFRDNGVSWVICGGESGPGARPCNVEWVRSIVSQCKAAGVPCFVKQLGERPFRQSVHSGNPVEPIYPLTVRGKGGDMAEWPHGLRVREFPAAVVVSGSGTVEET